uniref:NAD(P)(+)--arginine ADP-ribosyltransferase n=1 Tax=Catharus ustulatus TaxID=91951 RepID=A0A8C3UFP7_CATUS
PVSPSVPSVSPVSPHATNATPVAVPLDLVPDSFDDRYRGCGRAMAAALPALNRSELRRDGHFAEAWASGRGPSGASGRPLCPPLSPAQAMALLAYTAPVPLHRIFNAAVRTAGRSRQEYRDNFHFKTLHFLLTDALAALRAAQGPRARPGLRSGSVTFASASLRRRARGASATDTAFEVRTCEGAAVREFSFFPHEDEVLIPPFETFEVTNVTEGGDTAWIELRHAGTWSKYNCEWLRGDGARWGRGQGGGQGHCEVISQVWEHRGDVTKGGDTAR